MQATEVIKLILGTGDPLIGRLLLIDALGMKFRELKLRKNPDCPACGTHPTITKLIDYNEFCGIRGEEKPVETWRSRDSSRRTEAPPGRGRRPVRARRARAARIPDLQHRRISDSAGRSAEARQRTRFQPRDRGALQMRRAAARKRSTSCSRRDSRKSTTWLAGYWPGPIASIRKCRSTRSQESAVRSQYSAKGSAPALPFLVRRIIAESHLQEHNDRFLGPLPHIPTDRYGSPS